MALSREEFDARVSQLERVAARAPRAYSLKVALLGTLGYAYLLAGLAVMVTLVAALVWMLIHGPGRSVILAMKVGLPLLLLVAAVSRALWVRLPPPEGRELPRGPDTARLWAEVDEVRAALGGPRIHTLLLSDDFNAGIVQLPSLGLLGPTTNYLRLGLPLMQALSPEQFRAVLAHEFGHLSGSHGRVGSFVYRVRRTWSQVLESLEEYDGWGAAAFTGFFRWYAPFYSAYSFVLARAHEYEADRASAQVVGPAVAAQTLVAVELRGAHLEEHFWSAMSERARHQPRPVSPHAEMRTAFKSELEPAQAQRWLHRSLSRTTDSTDTHPCLKDRLGALGQTPRDPGPLRGQSAAEVLLGPQLAVFAEELDGSWRGATAEQWTEVHEEARKKHLRLTELEARGPEQPLTLEEEWERTSLAVYLRDAEVTLPMVRRMLTLVPEHVGAHYTLGRMLLARGEEAGLAHLETAMAADPDSILPASRLAVPWLEERERAEALAWRRRAEAHARVQAEAKEERDSLQSTDYFLAHGLSPEALRALAVQLHAIPRVEQAFLVRKEVKHFPERPLYVIGVDLVEIALTERDVPELVREIANAISLEAEFFVVPLNTQAQRNRLGKSLKQSEPTPFYVRARFSASEGRDAA